MHEDDCNTSATQDAYDGSSTDIHSVIEQCATALPNTGWEVALIVVLALILLGAGFAMRRASRSR